MQDQMRVQYPPGLDLVRDDTAHKVRVSGVQRLHQLIQLFPMTGRDCLLTGGLALASASGWCSLADVLEDVGQQRVALAVLEHLSHGHVDRVLVFLQPSVHGVGHHASVVRELEVDLEAGALLGLGLGEGGMLASMLGDELVLVGDVGGFGHDALLFEHREDAHLLLDEVDGCLQVGAEGHHLPHDALLLVLLLLEDEHEVVEELLETLVGQVDAELLEAVVFEGLEAGDVQDADEEDAFDFFDVQCQVDHLDEPVEHAAVDGLAQGAYAVGHLGDVLALVDKVVAHLDS